MCVNYVTKGIFFQEAIKYPISSLLWHKKHVDKSKLIFSLYSIKHILSSNMNMQILLQKTNFVKKILNT